ncbi:hypothetical protein LTR85_000976 [Meristemomyces frigidus]|nr:hypothetical protein LTR85_000976 [Meristemomyces frigidus]
MHSVKRAARWQSWFDDDSERRTYDPFNRYGQRRARTHDEETGPSATAHAEPSLGNHRPQQNARRGVRLQKANTFPEDAHHELQSRASSDSAPALAPEWAADAHHVNGSQDRVSILTGTEPATTAHAEERPTRRKTYPSLTIVSQLKSLFYAWINLLLLFIPAGFAVYYGRCSPAMIFIINFLAIVPSNAALIYVIDEWTPTGKEEAAAHFRGLKPVGAGGGAATADGEITREVLVYEDVEEPSPQLSRTTAVIAAILFTTLLAFNTEYATNSIQGVMVQHGLTDTFMGIVILPILGSDPTVIKLASLDNMDLALAMTLERAIQTALMIVPLIVLIAWGLHIDDMTLDFDGFSVAVLFASIIIVTYVVQEGKSNWLMGALLVKVFIIIGLASFFVD